MNFNFNISEKAKVTLIIYKDGQALRTIANNQTKYGGALNYKWDGKLSGIYAAPGSYSCYIKVTDLTGLTKEVTTNFTVS